ncbi:PD-(D/E)XK nuclease family protein [Bifidobacterium simiiventris]|uniref:PD-(D/E)XK nuclease family protein n=1 Tax=Bifidobacterium simiiventris TaxID=2834434 RepID=UPI001C570B20|nr:PD-(D/E)XK nuclease family protein [Bifidobacterium simiiventris]MBW3078908.1 PD-(D/E)XK nuclease family protein [Bifidobacterium simiiventris]
MRRDDAVVTVDDALDLLKGKRGEVLLVAGPPSSGKTSFAFDVLVRGLLHDDGSAVMTVSDRHAADLLSDQAIRRLGSSRQARPVTTLSAVAFRLISAVRKRAGSALPRLLNGAEQDALLKQVTETHRNHVAAGELCGTCLLLRDYFGADDWSNVMFGSAGKRRTGNDTDADDETSGAGRGVGDAFVMQLRDMISRMNELGVTESAEASILDALGNWSPHIERLRLQWRLAFALRRQYRQMVEEAYPHEYRLDSSRLLVEGAAATGTIAAAGLPRLMVIDDVQDLTLAGFGFLRTLHERGTNLVLVGNPDESVQTFRGSYPEYLFAQARQLLGARTLRIEPVRNDGSAATVSYKELVESRVSLSIHSAVDDDMPLPSRPGKLPQLAGSLPVEPLDDADAMPLDGSIVTAMYRSESEELDDIVWHIKRAHLHDGQAWNDMAVIAHDNATIRRFGERLRRDGVPVRYSSVTRPLKDEPFVQGLFSLLELADLHNRSLDDMTMSLPQTAAFVRSRVTTLMGSPLIGIGVERNREGRPARLAGVEAAMGSLGALSGVLDDDAGPTDERQTPLRLLVAQWDALRNGVMEAQESQQTTYDDSLVDDHALAGNDLPFGVDALYLMLEFSDADAVLASIQSVCGGDPHAKAFAHLWNLVQRVASGLRELPSREPQYALALAWDACGVAARWQRESLDNTDAGRSANDRLDTAMRLFDYAAGAAAGDWRDFLDRVRQMRIEADSLAKVAPLDQAVTLTTPAGAAGRYWQLVWMPALQQGVWPNLAARNTMFGGEDLADMMLFGHIDNDAGAQSDPGLAAVLASEQKSLLVALTRAIRQVSVSAVYNDDLVPSDFLYGYLPERFDRQRDAQTNRREYASIAETDRFHGLDATVRGIVASARTTLVTSPEHSPEHRDAIDTLRLLAEHDVDAADPRTWPFVNADDGAPGRRADGKKSEDESVAAKPPVVVLSPSDVDSIWACPVCWLMDRRFTGPRAGSVSASFGSLIHAVAQRASEEGLDLPSAFPDLAAEQRQQAVAERMMDIYHELAEPPSTFMDAVSRYDALHKDASAHTVLDNIAAYFVSSNTAEYPSGNVGTIEVGTLTSAECERSFSARFSLSDIVAAYNAIDGVSPVTSGELMTIMGSLIGGWPEAMDEAMTIRLTGRIDRLEHRTLPDGGEQIRLIDYKTGSVPPVKAIFNDLQLVCYQLGLAFPEDHASEDAGHDGSPYVAQSVLFHVMSNDAPAKSYGQESLYQPALFRGRSLNAGVFAGRYHYQKPSVVMDIPELPLEPPEGVREPAWRSFLELRGTQAVWSLTMIARVFYAAAASRSTVLEARPQPSHIKRCRLKSVCPACAGQIDTVFETRQS